MKHRTLATVLLVIGCVVAYFWQVVQKLGVNDPDVLGQVWNLSTSVYRVGLLTLVALAYRSKVVLSVTALLSAFDLMVAGCSAMWLYEPWEVYPGQELCSTRFHFPLGLLGAVIALILVINIVRGKR